MRNVVVLSILPNKEYVYTVVLPEDLTDVIRYNLTFRFRFVLYVEGVRISNGYAKGSELAAYDAVALDFFNNNYPNTMYPTLPYR